MLKVGIVGCGNIFTMHATSCDFLKNSQLVGVCDIKKDRADAAAKKYNVPAYYDYETNFMHNDCTDALVDGVCCTGCI